MAPLATLIIHRNQGRFKDLSPSLSEEEPAFSWYNKYIIYEEVGVNKLYYQDSLTYLEKIAQDMETLPALELKHLDPKKTVLIHIDLVEGFLNFGALHSKNAAGILPFVVRVNEDMKNYRKIFVLDSHEKDAEEFGAYPAHCVLGSGEEELVQELLPYAKGHLVLRKNSTNLFHSPVFLQWLEENEEIQDFVFVGVVTDICVLQACLSLRSYFNEWNLKKEIHVLLPGVDTFQLEITHHARGLMNLFGLYNMKMNGIHLYSDVK